MTATPVRRTVTGDAAALELRVKALELRVNALLADRANTVTNATFVAAGVTFRTTGYVAVTLPSSAVVKLAICN